MSNCLQPYELQHTRLPCPSPTPGACSDSCPLSQWSHPTRLSSVIPFSSHVQSFPASESFPMSQLNGWLTIYSYFWFWVFTSTEMSFLLASFSHYSLSLSFVTYQFKIGNSVIFLWFPQQIHTFKCLLWLTMELSLDKPLLHWNYCKGKMHVIHVTYQSYCLRKWLSGKESACQCRGHRRDRFSPWLGKIPWRREWQPTPLFLPGKSHGRKSLMGYSLWGCKELDMTEHTHIHHSLA